MGQKSGGGLPSGYVQYDYIEATAQNASIDTGVRASSDLVMQFHLYYARANGDNIIGTKGSADNNDFRYFVASVYEFFDMKNARLNYYNPPPREVTREVGNFYIKDLVNGTILATADLGIVDWSIPYNVNIGHTNNMQGDKIYFVKIYDSGVLVRDFIPAYSVLDDQYGLFDTVNQEFYGHENFIGGNT